MTELQIEYVDRRERGVGHTRALSSVAQKFNLTPDDVVCSLKRAEVVDRTGYFAPPGRPRKGKR